MDCRSSSSFKKDNPVSSILGEGCIAFAGCRGDEYAIRADRVFESYLLQLTLILISVPSHMLTSFEVFICCTISRCRL
ncbi:hypothetical protein M758_8G081400 [Ceratodon purpureus]|nr:hypothetical protein M758_8G081400 [Ceratodon purpureus]